MEVHRHLQDLGRGGGGEESREEEREKKTLDCVHIDTQTQKSVEKSKFDAI